MQPEVATQSLWATTDFDRLLHETWDGETFVFNPGSGHTHVLNDAAFALLERLATQPSTTANLAREFDAGTQARLPALRQQLRQLETVGLICRTRPIP